MFRGLKVARVMARRKVFPNLGWPLSKGGRQERGGHKKGMAGWQVGSRVHSMTRRCSVSEERISQERKGSRLPPTFPLAADSTY